MKNQFYFGMILLVVHWISPDVKASRTSGPSTSILPTTVTTFTTRPPRQAKTTVRTFTTGPPRLRTTRHQRTVTPLRTFLSSSPSTSMETTVATKPKTTVTVIPEPAKTRKEISKSTSDNTTMIGVSVAPIVILVGLVLCILCLIRKRTPKKNSERNSEKNRKRNSKEKDSEPPLPTVTLSALPQRPIVVTSVVGSSFNGNPSYDHTVVFDNEHKYSVVDSATGKEPNVQGELYASIDDVQKEKINEEEVIMQENEELYNCADSCSAEFGTDLKKCYGDENNYEILHAKEGVDENDKKLHESVTEKEPIDGNNKNVHDRESTIMFENDELYSSSVNLAEDETEVNAENEEDEYYEVIEEICQKEKRIRKKDSVILSENLHETDKTRQSFA